MFEILVVIAFIGLTIKFFGLAFRITWGAAKIVASLLFVLALPVLMICMIFAGGLALLLPIALVAVAIGMLRSAL